MALPITTLHTIPLTSEEVQEAILDLSHRKATKKGIDVSAHRFHTEARLTITAVDGSAVVTIKVEE
jgi:hypothetical protein